MTVPDGGARLGAWMPRPQQALRSFGPLTHLCLVANLKR